MARADRLGAGAKAATAAPQQLPAGAKRFRTRSGAILFDARQIAHDTVLYLSLVGSVLFMLLAFAGWS